jgi:hypothetical protein
MFIVKRDIVYDPNFNPSSDPYAASVIFNNTFNSSVNAQNTTWALGPLQEITTAPANCPKSNCLHLLQGGDDTAALYSDQGFGELGMVDLTQSYTIEFWFYATNIDQSMDAFGLIGACFLLRSDGSDPFYIYFKGNRSVVVGVNTSANPYTEFSTNAAIFNLNSWNHIAVVTNQSLNTITTYINGINCGQANYTTDWNGDPAHWEWGVGHDFDNGYDIYISNMRWTQAVRYTSNFTPTFINFYNSAN